MRASIYRDGSSYVLRPQFSPEEMTYLRGRFGASERERLAFNGNLKDGLWLWIQNDNGYRLRPIINGKGKPHVSGGSESRIPCTQIGGPLRTITTQDVHAERRWWKHNVPALYFAPQSPFNGEGAAAADKEPFNPLLSREPLHWQPPSGKDDAIKIVPPHAHPPAPTPAAVETAEKADVARAVEDEATGAGATAAAAEPEGLRVAPSEPPPTADPAPKIPFGREQLLVVGQQEIEGLRVMAELVEKRHARPRIPTENTPESRRDDLKQVIALLNSYMDDCGDDIVLKIAGNRVKASVLVVQEVDL